MNRWHRTLIALAASALVVSACGDASQVSPLDPIGPRNSGGFSVGGNRSDSTSVTQVQSTGETQPGVSEGSEGEGEGEGSTEYGGFSVGGN